MQLGSSHSKRIVALLALGVVLLTALAALALGRLHARASLRARIARMAELRDAAFAGDRFFASYAHGPVDQVLALDLGQEAPGRRPRLLPTTTRYLRAPTPSVDGSVVLVRDGGREATRLELVDGDDGASLGSVVPRAGEKLGEAALSPHGALLAYVVVPAQAAPGGSTPALRLRTLADHQEVELSLRVAPRDVTWAPVGHTLAWVEAGEVMRYTPGDKEPTRLHNIPGAHGLQWSPDGRTLAVCPRSPDCQRVLLVDAGSGELRTVVTRTCVTGVRWSSDGSRLLTRTRKRDALEVVPVDDGGAPAGHPLIVMPGHLIQDYAPSAAGDVYIVSHAPSFPQTLWRVRGPELTTPEIAYQTVALDRVSLPERLGLAGTRHQRPVYRYPRTCGQATAPGPVVTWIPCPDGRGHHTLWNQEIQYLTAAGYAVYVIDLYESSGHAADTLLDDLVISSDFVRAQPDAARDQDFMLVCCDSTRLGYLLVGERPRDFRGVVDLQGRPHAPLLDRLAQGPHPAILWLTFTETGSEAHVRAQVATALQARGLDLTTRSYATNHYYQDGPARQRILEDIGAFLDARSDSTCE